MWDGRFSKRLDETADSFNSSLPFDRRLYREDIAGSIAHAKMLAACGILSQADAEQIAEGLDEILRDFESGALELPAGAEDIHMALEELLTGRIGDAGKRLHTARSRNDQVALDLRMYVKREIREIKLKIYALIRAIVKTAKQHTKTIMPGYTHLQPAQPVTFAHHILAYAHMLARDIQRLDNTYERTNVLVLGSAALAATAYPIDREFTARELGFDSISLNSMDGVSDRDFAIELLCALSVIMMHLSRFSEEIILWSSANYAFVELDDAFSTGSSIMPQKKNPDVAELVRGKTGRVYGNLTALLTMMKGLPLAYNKDMQEDKEAVFDSADTVKSCLHTFSGMFETLKINEENMFDAAQKGFINATDCADYLTKKGMAFREAYKITGRLVARCIETNRTLSTLPLEEYKAVSGFFGRDIYDALDLRTCVAGRSVAGGPAETSVFAQIEYFEKLILEVEYDD